MNHRPYKWVWKRLKWKKKKKRYGDYDHKSRTVRLNTRIRSKHDLMWKTAGHEFCHQQLNKLRIKIGREEKLAYYLEKVTGQALHDFYHRFKNGGLPRCNGVHCHVNEAGGSRPRRRSTRTKRR